MISEILKALSYVAIVFGGATILSLIGVSALLGLEHMYEKWKERKNNGTRMEK